MNQKTIDEMKKSTRKLYMSITGGGLAAFGNFTEEGDGSAVFLGGQIPYNQEELAYLIGQTTKTVSQRTALLLSRVGYNRSIADTIESEVGKECVGIGATSSLVKRNGERAGREHKVCVAVSIFNSEECKHREYLEIILNEKRTRKQEEDITADAILLMADMNLCLRKAHYFHPNPTFRKNLNKTLGLTDNDVVSWELLTE